MIKKSFFFLIFLFSLFLFKNTQSNATPQIVMECPGLKIFKNWCAGEYKTNGTKSCIMISTPIDEKGEPPYKSRGEVVATIYHIPSEDSTGVVYITTGYTYKKGAIVTLRIDQNQKHEFNVIENDSAFTDDENVDKQIIIEMKKGNKMEAVSYTHLRAHET